VKESISIKHYSLLIVTILQMKTLQKGIIIHQIALPTGNQIRFMFIPLSSSQLKEIVLENDKSNVLEEEN